MLFRQIIHEDLGCASYLVADRESGVAVVVDPQWDVEPYRRLARDLDCSRRVPRREICARRRLPVRPLVLEDDISCGGWDQPRLGHQPLGPPGIAHALEGGAQRVQRQRDLALVVQLAGHGGHAPALVED